MCDALFKDPTVQFDHVEMRPERRTVSKQLMHCPPVLKTRCWVFCQRGVQRIQAKRQGLILAVRQTSFRQERWPGPGRLPPAVCARLHWKILCAEPPLRSVGGPVQKQASVASMSRRQRRVLREQLRTLAKRRDIPNRIRMPKSTASAHKKGLAT